MADVISPDLWLNLARLLTVLFTTFIGFTTYQTHLLLKRIELDFNVLLSLPETVARLVLVGLCLLLAWLSGQPATALGFVPLDSWQILAAAAGAGVIIQLAVNGVTALAIKIFGRQIYSPRLILNILPKHLGQWLPVALAFVPPVLMEELLFRSLWLGLFAGAIPLTLLIAVTSVIFGLMHQPQGKLGMIVAGSINVVFCLLFVWTGQLLVTFVAHYTVNLLQILFGYFQRDWLMSYQQQSTVNCIDKKLAE
jgi:membrane protease YdiL (CAAX protease family)